MATVNPFLGISVLPFVVGGVVWIGYLVWLGIYRRMWQFQTASNAIRKKRLRDN